jgi:hypothetical protein
VFTSGGGGVTVDGSRWNSRGTAEYRDASTRPVCRGGERAAYDAGHKRCVDLLNWPSVDFSNVKIAKSANREINKSTNQQINN